MTDNLLDDTPVDSTKNYLEELVGEGKKFKDHEALARGKYESDTYIKTLEGRLDELREEYRQLREDSTARAKLGDLIDQMKDTRLASNDPPPVKEVQKEPTYDLKQIESLVYSKIQEQETSKKEQENLNSVLGRLKERYGDNFMNSYKQQRENLGLTPEFANDLAKKHPSVFIKTFGLEAERRENFQAPPRGNIRSDNFKPTAPQQKTWSYYQELKKTKPDLYYDKKTAVEMHNSAIELGDAFMDGDFHAI